MIPKHILKTLTFLFFITTSRVVIGQQNISFVKEEVQITSKVLDEVRTVNLYRDTTKADQYTVIYLLDGEWNERVTSGILAQAMTWGTIPKNVMLVAIANQGSRDFDLTPVEDDTNFPGSGGATKFLEFISNELIPEVEKNIVSDNRLLIGHSFGGLFSLFTLSKNPDLFNGYIVLSPSTWFGQDHLFDQQYQQNISDISSKIFVFIGTGQYERWNVSSNEKYVNWLKNIDNGSLNIQFKLFEDRDHFSVVPTGIDAGLNEYFPGPELRSQIEEAYQLGIQKLDGFYNRLRQKFGSRLSSPDNILLEIAADYNAQKKNQQALELLLWYEPFATKLGDIYYYIGAISHEENINNQAVEYYKKALAAGQLPERTQQVIIRALNSF